MRLLLAAVVVLAVAQIVGRVFALARQPRVMGEMVAGILLGPSFLGRFLPATAMLVFPNDVLPRLRMVAQGGVVLFMFLVGGIISPALFAMMVMMALVTTLAAAPLLAWVGPTEPLSD